jgi:capsular exopolysaccharide synthesis family protein
MVRDLRQKVEMLKTRIRLAQEEAAQRQIFNPNPAYQQVAQQLKELDLEIDTLEKRRADLRSGRVELKGVSEQELLDMERDKAINEDIYRALLRRLENAQIAQRLDAEGQGATFLIVDSARLPLQPSKPNPLIAAVGSLALAILAGVGAVLLREYMDSSFRGYSDAKNYLKRPILACVPALFSQNGGHSRGRPAPSLAVSLKPGVSPEAVALKDPQSVAAEQYRLLRTHLLFLRQKKALKTVLITSALEAEGKTTTSVNLAVSMAQELDQQILLMDCDMRKNGVEKALNLSPGRGLSNYLANACLLDAAVRRTDLPNLTVMTAGNLAVPSPTKLLSSEKMQKLLDLLRSSYDFIIFDAPPALHLADVPVLTPYADGIVLVARVGSTPREVVVNAQKSVEQALRSNALGYVLTHVEGGIPSYVQRYLESSSSRRVAAG